MKIVILSFYSGSIERGVENWTYEMAKRLSQKHEVVVYQNERTKKATSYKVISTSISFDWSKTDSKSVISRRLFLDYKSILIARFTFLLIPLLWKDKPDIIIPTNGGWQTFLVRILSWIRGSRMVVVGHSGLGWDDRFNLWCLPNTFVALSKRALIWANTVCPLVKKVVIPNGVDLKVFSPFGEKAKVNLEQPIIIAVGAFDLGKRLDLTIKAVAQLKRGSLLILGRGELENDLKTLGNKLLGEKRFKLLHVDYKDIPEYYRASDVFTLPSWENEAFGMVYLEAMASNLPVVATDDELRREIIGEAGILVEPTSIEDYAEALEKALKKKWGDIPRKQAEKFGWNTVVNRYEQLFSELIT